LKATYIIIGLILLVFAYVISSITVPWIEWVGNIFPTPRYAPISLLPITYVFGGIKLGVFWLILDKGMKGTSFEVIGCQEKYVSKK
jgi:H+/Cl- antiporter ClcA